MRKSDGTIVGTTTWRQVGIGGLGFTVGGVIAADGTCMATRTDVGGAYRREGNSGPWTQIIDAAHMTIPTSVLGSDFAGVYEISIGPSDPSKWYMAVWGRMMRSTNRGVDWVDDSLNGTTGLYMSVGGAALGNRLTQHKLQQDFTNPDVAYLGTQKNGLWRRLPSTGWAKIASIPNSTLTEDLANVIIGIDRTSTLTAAGADQRRSVVYCASSGSGLYKSTDGGTTFSIVSGHPGAGSGFRVSHFTCDQLGRLWLVLTSSTIFAQNLYRSTDGGANWTNLDTSVMTYAMDMVEVDPKDSNRVIGSGLGKPTLSTNIGTSWTSAWEPHTQTYRANTCTIMSEELEALSRVGQSVAGIMLPHPTLNRDYAWGGYGVTYTASPWAAMGTKSMVWIEDTAGIEELVAQKINILSDGTTFLSEQDRGVILQDRGGRNAHINWPVARLTYGTNVDQAIDDPNFIVARIIKGTTDSSGYSTDKGQTWQYFAASPTTNNGGSIAVSNKNQIVVVPGQEGWPVWSSDYGATWTDCVFSGYSKPTPGALTGWVFGITTNTKRYIMVADKDAPGTFYAYNDGRQGTDLSKRGVWKSTDGGHNFTRVADVPLTPGQNPSWSSELFCVAGHLFFVPGFQDTAVETANMPIYRSENGGASWTTLTGLNEAWNVTWGKAKPGSAYPYALYGYGFKSGVLGLYRSDDKGATWTAVSYDNWFDNIITIGGDPSEFGRLVVGYAGTGFRECQFKHQVTIS